MISCRSFAQEFIYVHEGKFIKNGTPYQYIGTNFWYGMNLGTSDRERLIRELDQLNKMGVHNLRVMAASEGNANAPWRLQPCLQTEPGIFNEELLIGLDFLLHEMKKRNMEAVLCLNNFWPWSGGMSQYISWANNNETIPFPPPAKGGTWHGYQNYTAQFYTNTKALTLFNQFIQHIVTRKNSITGVNYVDDPTIMAWQLANEPEGVNNAEAYRKWIHQTAATIKALDKNHMVSIGSEGSTPFPQTGNNFEKDHLSEHIDYCTFHLWIQNWGWYNPLDEDTFTRAIEHANNYINEHIATANKLNKPIVLEEFGISRDENSHHSNTPCQYRDQYYTHIFKTLYRQAIHSNFSGANFWAWGGEGRPRHAKSIWQTGDDFIGDPPHEHQGWYSVYNTDTTTHRIIEEYTTKMASLSLHR